MSSSDISLNSFTGPVVAPDCDSWGSDLSSGAALLGLRLTTKDTLRLTRLTLFRSTGGATSLAAAWRAPPTIESATNCTTSCPPVAGGRGDLDTTAEAEVTLGTTDAESPLRLAGAGAAEASEEDEEDSEGAEEESKVRNLRGVGLS